MSELKIGDYVDGWVTKVVDYGAFVKLSDGKVGLVHISQMADTFVKSASEHLQVGQKVNPRVVKIDPAGRIDLSLKAPRSALPAQKDFRFSAFEEKLKKFLNESQKRQADLKENLERKSG